MQDSFAVSAEWTENTQPRVIAQILPRVELSMYNTFLSYNNADRPLVATIAVALRDAAGIEVFYDEWSLLPGDEWQEELEKSLWASGSCAIFIGEKGFGPWHKQEMRSALERRVRDQEFRVIPVLLPSFANATAPTIPPFLRRYSWVDFRNGIDNAKEFEKLVRGILGQKSKARHIADQVRLRLENANSDAISMVHEHSKVDGIASASNPLVFSSFGAGIIFLGFALLGYALPGRTLLLLIVLSFFIGLPCWYSWSELRFQKLRHKYAKRFNDLYGEWRFRIVPERIFKLETIYCPMCDSPSICSRLNGMSAYRVRNALWKSAVLVGGFGGVVIFGAAGASGLSVQALLLFVGTLLSVRELWGWRHIKFLCLVRGHEFTSFEGIFPRLIAKLLGLFTRD